MVTVDKISKHKLPELIQIAFENDKELLEKYHVVNTGFEDSVTDTVAKIEETSFLYKLKYFKVICNKKPVGFFVTGDNFLYSFGINPKFRTRDIIVKWWDLIKNELADGFVCLLNKKNERAAAFLKKQGMVLVNEGNEILTFKYK